MSDDSLKTSSACLILNGEIDQRFVYSRLAGKSPIYCVDGGYSKVIDLGLSIEAIIGDLDSLSKQGIDPSTLPRLIHCPDQDTTDFGKALKLLYLDYDLLEVYGASGGSPDHLLGNLSVALGYKDFVKLRFYDPGMTYFFASQETVIRNIKGRIVSVMPFPKVSGIEYEGLEYDVKDAEFALGRKIGIRNTAISDDVTIRYKGGCALIFVED